MTCSSPHSRRLLWQVEITLTQLFLNLYLSSFIKTRPSDIYLYERQSTLNVELNQPVLRTRLANRWGMYLTALTPLRISEFFFFSLYYKHLSNHLMSHLENGLQIWGWIWVFLHLEGWKTTIWANFCRVGALYLFLYPPADPSSPATRKRTWPDLRCILDLLSFPSRWMALCKLLCEISWKGFAFLSSPGQFLLLSLLAGLLKQLKTNWNLWKCFQANVNVLSFAGLWKICMIHRIERLHTSSRVMKHLTRIGVRHPPQERPFKLLICCSS